MEESPTTEHGLKEKCPAPSSAEGLQMPEPNLILNNNYNEMCLKYFLASFGKIIFWIQLFYSSTYTYGDKSTSVYHSS